jgi:transcriptional regulator with XRE-family HTH domain
MSNTSNNGNGERDPQPRHMRRHVVDSSRFATRLRHIVELAGGPKEVAYYADISLSALYNYLNGRIPQFDIVVRLARYAGVPTDWFVVDDEMAERTTPHVGSANYAEGRSPELGVNDPRVLM